MILVSMWCNRFSFEELALFLTTPPPKNSFWALRLAVTAEGIKLPSYWTLFIQQLSPSCCICIWWFEPGHSYLTALPHWVTWIGSGKISLFLLMSSVWNSSAGITQRSAAGIKSPREYCWFNNCICICIWGFKPGHSYLTALAPWAFLLFVYQWQFIFWWPWWWPEVFFLEGQYVDLILWLLKYIAMLA